MKPPEIEYFITEIPLAIENPRVHGQNLLEISRRFPSPSYIFFEDFHRHRTFDSCGT